MAIILQETLYNGGKFAMFVSPLHINKFHHHLAEPLQETVRDHVCLQAKLPMVTKQETSSIGNKSCIMVCTLCLNEPPHPLSKPIQEGSPCQDHSLVLLSASSVTSAMGPYLSVAKKKVV